MSSKGSKIVPVRIPADLLDEIEQAIASRNFNSPGEPWTVSDYIRKAIADKLAHMRRSRMKPGRKARLTAGDVAEMRGSKAGEP